MPFELHADYDRDGRLTATAAEYSRRMTAPGARIFPNLDRDGRALPAKVESGNAVEPDWQRASGIAQDKEPVPIRVVVTPPDDPNTCTLFLRGEGPLGTFIRVRDDKLRLIQPDPRGRKTEFIVPIAGTSVNLFVETITAGGTWRTSLPNDPNPRRLELQLFCRRNGSSTLVDRGLFEVPQILVIDDLAPAERIYIAQADREDNVPSLRDVEREIAGTGVPLVVIPESENFKDVWVQDQFQMAYCPTPNGPLRVLVHCPRVRANVYWVEKSLNLAMVVESHFRSTDLAIYDDLMDRLFPIRDVVGTAHSMSLIDSQHAYLEMGTVFRYRRMLLNLLLFVSKRLKSPDAILASVKKLTEAPTIGLAEAHAQSAELLKHIQTAIGTLKKEQTNPDFQSQLDQYKEKAGIWKSTADKAAPSKRPGVIEVPLDTKTRIEITAQNADKLFDRLSSAHDSLTYGGNIECSPPMSSVPHGKLVAGTTDRDTDGAIDPDVLRFYESQDMPVVEVDSTWLHVGHVDEFMGFLASPKAPKGFVIARASPKFGVDLIDTATALYLSGLPGGHLHKQFQKEGIHFARQTLYGPHPVTMMLRGKLWEHAHPKEAFEPMEPPEFFKDFSLHSHVGIAVGPSDPEWDPSWDRFVPGPLAESIHYPEGKRRYRARMSVLEWQGVDDGSNEDIEQHIASKVDPVLAEAFPDVTLLKIPVLFDRVPVTAERDDKGNSKRNFNRTVKSFLPNAANFQTVNDRVLVPRPYGPRMKPDSVAAVLKAVFEANVPKFKLPTLDAGYFRRRGLLNSELWITADLDWRYMPADADKVAAIMRDGFPKDMDRSEIARKIQAANPGVFSGKGELRSGWQRLTVPDGTVDLFEAAIYVQFESVGATPRFVDSWHYHIHGGQIHCGTNVLRKPRRT